MEQKNINMGEFKTEMERISYAMGMNMGEYMAHLPLQIDPAMVLRGIAEILAGNPKLSREDYQSCMQQMQQMLQKAGQEEAARLAQTNAEAGAKFLAENAKAPGIVTLPSGLQYQVVAEGNGAKPTANDKVRVHYTGTLLDGQVFDSSVQRGEPVEFGVTQVIPGWVEGLQLMPVGSKYKFFIPANLAYGERGAGQHIQPNATLVFDVELLDIVK